MNEFSTFNPSTAQVLKTYRYASDQEIEKALAVLSRGSRQRLTATQKRVRLGHFAQALTAKKQDLGQLITREMGKPLAEAMAEVEKSVTAIEYALQNFEQELADEFVQTKDTQLTVRKQALGPVFAVMPWNFPIWQILRVLPMSFAAGNPVLLKHSDLVAGTAGLLADLAGEALGLEYFQNLYLNHDQAAQIIADTRIRAVTMTGSARGGREIAAQAGRSLKKVVLELGGSDPYLVFSDADVSAAAKLCVQTRLLNNGQSCISGKRFLIHEKIYDQFITDFCHELGQAKIGDPMLTETKLGPLAQAKFKAGLQKQIEQLQSQGGQKIFEVPLILENELKAGAFFAPQVFAVSGLEPAVTHDEFFGPVALMMKFKSEDHAIQLANASVYGLGGGVFSKDLEVCRRVSDRLDCGLVAWNDFVRSHPAAPFGGVKDSGFGRELGACGFRELLNLKTLSRRL